MLALALLTGSCARAGQKSSETMDTFKTKSGKTVTVTPIKHGSLEINFDGREFQIDPVATAVEPATDYTKMPKADYILVTHDHYDHFDAEAITALSKPDTRVIMNQTTFNSFGKGTVMHNGDSLRLAEDIMLYAVPAYNTTPGHTKFHPKGRDNGYILVLDGLRLYIGSDMEDIPELADVKDIDVAFLPCNQPFTMTPAQLRHATQMVKPKVLFPYHLSDTDKKEIERQLEGLGIDVRMRHFE